jgi:hypothetical protein
MGWERSAHGTAHVFNQLTFGTGVALTAVKFEQDSTTKWRKEYEITNYQHVLRSGNDGGGNYDCRSFERTRKGRHRGACNHDGHR